MSTRKVKAVTEELCGHAFSASTISHINKGLDAALASEIPDTLHDLLMARLDQLGTAKEVTQVAAVIGREFSREFLEALLPLPAAEIDTALATMVSTAIVQRRPQQPVFEFRHALIQDAAYGSLLRLGASGCTVPSPKRSSGWTPRARTASRS